jgi:hypothetical protein
VITALCRGLFESRRPTFDLRPLPAFSRTPGPTVWWHHGRKRTALRLAGNKPKFLMIGRSATAMTAGQPETTLLETARRHVREGEERIVRQEATVAELERNNHAEAAGFARGVLETMCVSLDLMKQHLRRIEERC